MAYLHDEHDDEIATRPPEREVTLSTGTILAIFFGLTVLCGLFFGFGYSMGSKSRVEPQAAAEASPTPPTNFSTFKPAPGAPAIKPVPGYMSQKEADAANKLAATTGTKPASVVTPPPAAATRAPLAPAHEPAAAAPTTQPPAPVSSAKTTTPPPAAPRPVTPAAAESAGSYVVQVAAVSHQEDADLLVTALQRKGYTVAAHTTTTDKLFHIQLGPYGSKKDADAMRQRLLTDGYNAIVK